MDAPATNGPVAEGTLPTDTSAAAEMLSDSEVVWQVDIGGGLVPFAVAANDVPEVTIYGDGRIFVAEELETPPWTVPPPVEVLLGSVPPEQLRAFLDDAAASEVIDESVNYGTPRVADLGGTTVRLRSAAGPAEVSVHGLGYDARGDLGTSEIEARNTLETLIERSRRLGDRPTPWVPDRVEVTDLPGTHEFGTTPEGTTPWPGPRFVEVFGTVKPNDTVAGSRCAEIAGVHAAEVFSAARVSGMPFVDDQGAELQVVVRALLPGEVACDGP